MREVNEEAGGLESGERVQERREWDGDGAQVGPQWSYVPWLAVTAGWEGTVFEVGGGLWQGGPYTGSSEGPGPQPRTDRGNGCWGGKQRETGSRVGEGTGGDGHGGGWQRGAEIQSRSEHSPLSCSLPFLAAAALPIAAAAAGAGPGATARRVLAAAGGPRARWAAAAAAAPWVAALAAAPRPPPSPLLPASLRARPPGNLSPSPCCCP